MAGLIQALFGGRPKPPDPNPLPGIGGYDMPPGPAGQTGFPGSTSQTRTFRGTSPVGRASGVRSPTNTGAGFTPGSTTETRQVTPRVSRKASNPRLTPGVTTVQTGVQQSMQHNSDAEFYGGPALHTRQGNNTAGGHPGRRAAAAGGHDTRHTTTPWTQAQPIIGRDTPGAQNVRNQVAQRYHNQPGQVHTYRSAPRGDLPPVLGKGQQADGNVHPDAAITQVSVPNRFVFAGGGHQTWAIQREMPYGGRGDGARGADLNGQRFYSTGQAEQFLNAGVGQYGIAREYGSDYKRPVSFTEPAPWTAQYYDTTEDVGTADNPNQTPGQAPNLVYVSPSGGRASNSTGRTH